MKPYETNIDLQLNLAVIQNIEEQNYKEIVDTLIVPVNKIEWSDMSYAIAYIERTSAN